MTNLEINSILVPVFPNEDEMGIRSLIQNGLVLATWWGAHLRWIIPEGTDLGLHQLLDAACFEFRRRRKSDCSTSVIVGEFNSGIMKKIADEESGLLLLREDQRGLFRVAQGLSKEKSKVLEQTHLPVWIVPARLKMKSDPVSSILVPMSGEKGASEALDFGIRLGNRHHVPVDVLHITSSKPRRECDKSSLGYITDQFYHEYPGLVEELIAQGSPYSSPIERQVIRHFCHCYGDVAHELRKRISRSSEILLLFEWKGRLDMGKAEKIKLLLRRASGPILLIREDSRDRSQLRIGRQFGSPR